MQTSISCVHGPPQKSLHSATRGCYRRATTHSHDSVAGNDGRAFGDHYFSAAGTVGRRPLKHFDCAAARISASEELVEWRGRPGGRWWPWLLNGTGPAVIPFFLQRGINSNGRISSGRQQPADQIITEHTFVQPPKSSTRSRRGKPNKSVHSLEEPHRRR